MRIALLIACAVLDVSFRCGTVTAATGGEHWVSPDGVISLDVPADGTWTRVPDPPAPALAMWLYGDKQTRLIATATPRPGPGPLERAGLEEGTCHALPGSKVGSSRESTLDGFPLFAIVAEGDFQGQPYTLKQVIVPIGPTVYKIMSGGPGNVDLNASLRTAYESLAIAKLPAGVTRPIAAAAIPPVVVGQTSDGHTTSMLIAAIGCAMLVIAGAIASVILIHRRTSPPALPPLPLPPPLPPLPPPGPPPR